MRSSVLEIGDVRVVADRQIAFASNSLRLGSENRRKSFRKTRDSPSAEKSEDLFSAHVGNQKIELRLSEAKTSIDFKGTGILADCHKLGKVRPGEMKRSNKKLT